MRQEFQQFYTLDGSSWLSKVSSFLRVCQFLRGRSKLIWTWIQIAKFLEEVVNVKSLLKVSLKYRGSRADHLLQISEKSAEFANYLKNLIFCHLSWFCSNLHLFFLLVCLFASLLWLGLEQTLNASKIWLLKPKSLDTIFIVYCCSPRKVYNIYPCQLGLPCTILWSSYARVNFICYCLQNCKIVR